MNQWAVSNNVTFWDCWALLLLEMSTKMLLIDITIKENHWLIECWTCYCKFFEGRDLTSKWRIRDVVCKFVFISRPTQLPSLSEHEQIVPSPVPSVPEFHQSPVTRPVSRRTAPSVPPQTDPEELWVERIVRRPPIEVTTNHDRFDVYIDEVRFIPDNATVIKVNNLEVARCYLRNRK